MPRNLSAPALASQNAEATGQAWLTLITLSHATLSEPIRVVDNNEHITSNGDLYAAWNFEITLPGEDPDNPANARLTIGNVDPEILRALRTINSPPQVTIQVVLSDTPDIVEAEFTGLVLRNANYDAGQISGDLVFEEILTEPVATSLTPADFPGLF
jgi:hypothetical protein